MLVCVEPFLREGPPCSNSLSELDSKKGIAENGGSNGDFLTLAPPSITSPHPNTRSKQNPILVPYQVNLKTNTKPTFHFSTPFPTLNLTVSISCFKGNSSDPLLQHLPFYSFLPPVNPQNDTSATSPSNCNGGEVGGSVDLNLKL